VAEAASAYPAQSTGRNGLRQACARQRVVILIDAVNQFDSALHSPGPNWLPADLPANACVILSAVDGPALGELREVELKPLSAADGEAIVEQFLKRYRKQLEPHQRTALLGRLVSVLGEDLRQ
jgi:hypothetical protein